MGIYASLGRPGCIICELICSLRGNVVGAGHSSTGSLGKWDTGSAASEHTEVWE